jgi:hypothetical protein
VSSSPPPNPTRYDSQPTSPILVRCCCCVSLRFAQRVSCHLLVLHGARSHLVSHSAAQRLCDAATAAASAAVLSVPKAGHHLLDDAPLQLRNALLGFLLQCDAALLVRNKVIPPLGFQRGGQQSVATPQAARVWARFTLRTLQEPILLRPWCASR